MNIFTLDACALIAYLNEEKGWDVISDIIEQATYDEKNTKIYMNKLNLLEVYYDAVRQYNVEKADWTMKVVEMMPVKIDNEWDNKVFRNAGILKIKYRMSLADSIAIAESIARDGTLVTSDHHELEAVERGEGVKILWFR